MSLVKRADELLMDFNIGKLVALIKDICLKIEPHETKTISEIKCSSVESVPKKKHK